jgi:hypothetical protein
VLSGLIYQEEDSYINPSNVSKVNQSRYADAYKAPVKKLQYGDINNSNILFDGQYT